jgi:hypothetical protein
LLTRFRAAPASSGGGYKPPAPSSGGFKPPAPSSGGFKPPTPSTGGFKPPTPSTPSSKPHAPTPSYGGASARATPASPSTGGYKPPVKASPSNEPAGSAQCRALYDFNANKPTDLSIQAGDVITGVSTIGQWWKGTNSRTGAFGSFPANYVEQIAQSAASSGLTVTATYAYSASRSDELTFPKGATITNVEKQQASWWFGHYNGSSGLFPSNYVEAASAAPPAPSKPPTPAMAPFKPPTPAAAPAKPPTPSFKASPPAKPATPSPARPGVGSCMYNRSHAYTHAARY